MEVFILLCITAMSIAGVIGQLKTDAKISKLEREIEDLKAPIRFTPNNTIIKGEDLKTVLNRQGNIREQ